MKKKQARILELQVNIEEEIADTTDENEEDIVEDIDHNSKTEQSFDKTDENMFTLPQYSQH